MRLIGAFQKFILRIVSDSFDFISSFVKYLCSNESDTIYDCRKQTYQKFKEKFST